MNYVSNIDTIYILVNISNYEIVCKKVLDLLEKEKEIAKLEVANNANYKHFVTINNINFELLSNGSKGYAYILHNNGYEVKVSKYKSKIKNFMPIQVRISAEYLWSNGLITSWEIIKNWLEITFGFIKNHKISRVDLCTHVSNVDFITDYNISYKGYFKKDSVNVLNYTNKKINAITLGSRKGKNVYCRMYDKTLEVKETKSKMWFFNIWQDNNLDINNVWNVEFELKSKFLREFNINTIEDLYKCLQNVWKYCTTDWLVKIDRANKRSERCPINSDWLEIQKAYDSFNSIGFIERKKQIEIDAESLIPNIVGNITSYSARKGITDIHSVFNELYTSTQKYLEEKEKTFEDEVKRKNFMIGGVK